MSLEGKTNEIKKGGCSNESRIVRYFISLKEGKIPDDENSKIINGGWCSWRCPFYPVHGTEYICDMCGNEMPLVLI